MSSFTWKTRALSPRRGQQFNAGAVRKAKSSPRSPVTKITTTTSTRASYHWPKPRQPISESFDKRSWAEEIPMFKVKSNANLWGGAVAVLMLSAPSSAQVMDQTPDLGGIGWINENTFNGGG